MWKVIKESNGEQAHNIHKTKQILLRIIEKKARGKSKSVTTIQILLIVPLKIIKNSNNGRKFTHKNNQTFPNYF